MDTISCENTLLALLLALRNLEDPLSLSPSERAQLYEVGEQLELDPDDWEFIEEGLLAVVTANTFLNKQFQTAKTQLAAVDIQQLLPTDNDIVVDLNILRVIERRGNGSEEQENRPPIVKITWKFLKHDNIALIIKKSTWLERVVKSLNY